MSDNDDHPQKSSRDEIMLVAVIVVMLGLVAALGWPKYRAYRDALDRDRASRQDKAIAGNLRQLSSGADIYFQNTGLSSVTYTTIVGTNSSQYIRTFQTVANETYTRVMIQGQPITAGGIAGARTITYGP